MLFKNVVNSMRINALSQIFDNSIFIVSNRDKLDIAQSILNARIALYNNKNHSWSVIASALQTDPDIPYYKQIVSQIKGVTSNINLARKNIGGNKFIFVDTFLISCRILGRHLESWILNEIRKLLKKKKIKVNI